MFKINLGCGFDKLEGYINIDCRADVNPEMVHDITTGLIFETDSVDEVRAYNILEHIAPAYVIPLIEEIYRVLKPDGLFDSLTPSTDGRGAFQDPTHLSFWNINSWDYYCDDEYRRLINIKAKFTGTTQDIVTSKDGKVIHTHAILRAVKDGVYARVQE